jgi:hypothetical protein
VNNGKSKARSHRATHPCASVRDASKIILHVHDKTGPNYKDNSHIPGPEKHRMTAADTASHSQSSNNLCIVLVRLLLDPAHQNGHQDLLPSVLYFFYILHCNIGKVLTHRCIRLVQVHCPSRFWRYKHCEVYIWSNSNSGHF